jgi:hypothetical protein
MVMGRSVCFPENVTVKYDHDYTLEPINGDIHMLVQNPQTTVIPGRVYIHLTNLFNGDSVLGEYPHTDTPLAQSGYQHHTPSSPCLRGPYTINHVAQHCVLCNMIDRVWC